MNEEKRLEEMDLDALREVISIGTGHSATALSSLIDKEISMKLPETKIIPLRELVPLLGGDEKNIVCVYFRFFGGLNGGMFLFFPYEDTHLLLEMLMATLPQVDKSNDSYTEMMKSALMEVGNILVNSYINALAELLDEEIFISIPYYAQDMLSAVVDYLLIQIAQSADYALVLKTDISAPGLKLGGNIVFFPDEVSLEKILKRIGVRN